MNAEATQWKRYFAVGMRLIFGRQSDCATRNFADKKHSAIKAGEPKHCVSVDMRSI